jgi:hypothetical protein
MAISDADRARIVEAMARAISDAFGYSSTRGTIYIAASALDAALSAGLADAIREQSLREAEGQIDEIVTRLYRRFKDWNKRGFGPDDVTWCEVRADVVAAIEALIGKPAPAHKGDEQ